jgi:hypothetical protein
LCGIHGLGGRIAAGSRDPSRSRAPIPIVATQKSIDVVALDLVQFVLVFVDHHHEHFYGLPAAARIGQVIFVAPRNPVRVGSVVIFTQSKKNKIR